MTGCCSPTGEAGVGGSPLNGASSQTGGSATQGRALALRIPKIQWKNFNLSLRLLGADSASTDVRPPHRHPSPPPPLLKGAGVASPLCGWVRMVVVQSREQRRYCPPILATRWGKKTPLKALQTQKPQRTSQV